MNTLKVYWSFLLSFVNGALLCYISAFPIALFLTHYGSESLPKIYLAVAFLSMLFGVAYTFFEYRLAFNKLIVGLAFVIGSVLLLLGSALISLSASWVIVLLLIWATMAYDLLDFAVWSVINRIYSIQQAKNSFGIIGGCQSIGGLTAGILAPVFVDWIGLDFLVFFLGIAIFGLVSIIFFLLKHVSPQEQEETEELDEAPDTDNLSFKTLIHNRYILKLVSLVMFSIFAMYLVDLLFNTAAEAQYPTEASLAGFLGVFFGLVDGVDLFCSVLLYGWLLKRIGLVWTLFVLPVLGLLISLPIIILAHFSVMIGLVFWFIVGLKLCEESLRGSLTEMSNLLLLQPFSLKLRSFLQAKLDSIVMGFATALISVILIVISSTVGSSVEILSFLTLVCFISSIAVLSTLKSDYITVLSKAIATRLFTRGKQLVLTKEDMNLFKNYLSSPYPDEVIYALNTIEQLDKEEFMQALPAALFSTEPTLQIFAIEKIQQYHLVQYNRHLLSLIQNTESEHVLIKAFTSVAFLNYALVQPLVNNYIHEQRASVLAMALNVIFTHETDVILRALATERLQDLAVRNTAFERARAAAVIAENTEQTFNELLFMLAKDSSPVVRQAAFIAILKKGLVLQYPLVIIYLDGVSLGGDFLLLLKQEFKKLQPILDMHFSALTQNSQIKIIKFLAQVRDESSRALIERCALDENLELRHTALKALTYFDTPCQQDFLQVLQQQIISEAQALQRQHQYLLATPDIVLTQLLLSILRRKKQLTQERLMLSLAVYYNKDTITKAQKGLDARGENELGYAIELIDTLLIGAHKKLITPLLSDIFLADHLEPASLDSQSFNQVLQDNLRYLDNEQLTVVSCMACIYIIKHCSIDLYVNEIEALKLINHPLINEVINT